VSLAIGIDLGTTNTVVAAVVDGVAVTLEDEQGRRLLPSIVSFHPSGTVLVGDVARERRLIDPENTIFSVKPLLGRTFDSDEVVAAIGRFPFQIVEGAKNSTMVMARDVAYALPEISAFVLRRAKAIAERALGQPVDRAVITVPANFNDLQRASTKIAGKLAGLEVMRILNEPTAAALAYGQSIAKAEKIAIYDLGGGTFDVTLLDLTGNVFEVLATAGDTALGGDDLDRLLAERIALEVIKRFNFDPRSSPVAFGRLRITAEELKKELSDTASAQREVSGIGYGEGGHPIVMPYTLSREELERLALPLIERTVQVARQSIEIIGMQPKNFDRVILVGGSTRMPMVGRMVEQLFGQPPHLKVNPDEVVALGAAIQAHALNRSKTKKAKKPSAHDQLAGAQPAPKIEVPRAPAVPGTAPAAPAASGDAATPQYIAFSKSAAVISWGPPRPGAQGEPSSSKNEAPTSPPPPPDASQGAGAPTAPTAPRKPPPPVPKRGGTDHASTRESSRTSIKPIEGKSVQFEEQIGPKPARLSGAPSGPSASSPPPLRPSALRSPDAGTYSAKPGVPEPEPEPEEVVPDLGAIIAAAPEEQPPADDAAFARGSAVATSDNAPLLIDVTPLSLRVETVGGYSDVLIAANSPVPCEKTRTFLTASDNQTVVRIRVAQGESAKFAENTPLGELELSGLRGARRGEVKVMVTFELDADGILNVRAKDKETERETQAAMRLLGTSTDADDMSAMAARQARTVVA
jgi:molecular chaperone DnaK